MAQHERPDNQHPPDNDCTELDWFQAPAALHPWCRGNVGRGFLFSSAAGEQHGCVVPLAGYATRSGLFWRIFLLVLISPKGE